MTSRRSLAVLCLAVALLCGCHAAGGLFTPAEDGAPAPKEPITGQPEAPAQTIIREVAESTGNPLLIGGVGVVNALLSYVLARATGSKAKKEADAAVQADAAKEWSVDEAVSMAAALRAAGFKVERAS